MDGFLKDIRYGTRMLIKSGSLTLIAIFTLALGIGANTAIFSVVNAVLLRPLPYQNPDRIMVLFRAPFNLDQKNPLSHSTLLDWSKDVNSFESVAAYNGDDSGVNLTGGSEPERVSAREISTNLFDLLGAKPHMGRWFTEAEAEPGKGNVAIISYSLWQRQFGGNPELLDQKLSLNGVSFTVVGIASPGFNYPDDVELWVPFSFVSGRAIKGSYVPNIIGRLKEGVSRDEAQAEMDLISKIVEENFPSPTLKNVDRSIKVIPIFEEMVKDIRTALLILFGAVGFVLLIACANVANLLLARATARYREFAIRAAVGAGRGRIIRQLLAESIMLAVIGGGMGLLFALWGVDILKAIGPEDLPRLKDVAVDSEVFAFVVGISVLTGLIFGLAPAIKASKVDLNEALKEGATKSSAGFGRRGVGNLLVVAEIALAIVLLIGAGLLVKSFARVMQNDLGIDTENVLTLALSLPPSRYPKPDQQATFYQQAIERLGAIPEAEVVAASSGLPLAQKHLLAFPFTIEGVEMQMGGPDSLLSITTATPNYFEAMGIPLVEGRDFADQDRKGNTQVIVISQAMAKRFWPDQSAIGKRLTLAIDKGPREVVGVVGDTRQFGVETFLPLESYLPYQQSFFGLNNLVVRTKADPTTLIAAVRGEIQSIDQDLPVYDIKTMEQRLSLSVSKRRFTAVLLSAFAAIALLLAGIGIYGVISYSVSQRMREMGIRLALGARPADILMLVLKKGFALSLVGLALGIGAALALTRLMSSLLYEVSPTDTAIFVMISAGLLVVTLAACILPARRAMRVEPNLALRHE